MEKSSIGCKKFQRVHPEWSFTRFNSFWFPLLQAKFLLLMTKPTVPNGSKELCILQKGGQFRRNGPSSESVTKFLDKSFFTWNNLVLAAKCSKECAGNKFWKLLNFKRKFSVGQTFACYGRTYCPNWLKWTVPSLIGWPLS